jgi:Tol biopolymer transport system component
VIRWGRTRVCVSVAVAAVAAAALWSVGVVASGPAVGDAWPGLNGRIAFKSDPNNIWTINPDGSGALQLTTGTLENEEPHWSADGSKIVFTRSGADVNSNQDIWSMNADGTNQVRLNLSTGSGFTENPSWSPDGTKIIFTKAVDASNGHEELWTANADGSGQVQVTNDANHKSSEAVYSPNGTKIAFQLEPFSVALGATAETQDHSTTVSSAGVTGQVICNGGTGGGEIWVMDANGTNPVQVTDNPGCFDENPNWSPDGTKIAFTSNQTGRDQVWVVNPNGTNPTQLTTTSLASERPVFSPDGAQIAFASDRTEADHIWVMNADGSNPVQVTPDTMRNNGQPNWQPIIPPPPPTPPAPQPAAIVTIAPRFTG